MHSDSLVTRWLAPRVKGLRAALVLAKAARFAVLDRAATPRSGIMTPELYHPVLDCFVRGMPYAYRHTDSPEGTNVLLEISGECGGSWVLTKGIEGWHFVKESPKQVACKVTLPQAIAWRVFTKGMDHASARQQAQIEGDVALADGIFGLTAIVG